MKKRHVKAGSSSRNFIVRLLLIVSTLSAQPANAQVGYGANKWREVLIKGKAISDDTPLRRVIFLNRVIPLPQSTESELSKKLTSLAGAIVPDKPATEWDTEDIWQIVPSPEQPTPVHPERIKELEKYLNDEDEQKENYAKFLPLYEEMRSLEKKSEESPDEPDNETQGKLKILRTRLSAIPDYDRILSAHIEYTKLKESTTPPQEHGVWMPKFEDWAQEDGWGSRSLTYTGEDGSLKSLSFDLKMISLRASLTKPIKIDQLQIIGALLLRNPASTISKEEATEIMNELRDKITKKEEVWAHPFPVYTVLDKESKNEKEEIHCSLANNRIRWHDSFVVAIFLQKPNQKK
jgi:hypothetical protein